MKNHLGTYECKLCLTLHNTEVLWHCRTLLLLVHVIRLILLMCNSYVIVNTVNSQLTDPHLSVLSIIQNGIWSIFNK